MTDKVKDRRKKKTENTCISSSIFFIVIATEVFYPYLFLRSDLFIILKFCFNIFGGCSNLVCICSFTIDLRPYLSVLKLFTFS